MTYITQVLIEKKGGEHFSFGGEEVGEWGRNFQLRKTNTEEKEKIGELNINYRKCLF